MTAPHMMLNAAAAKVLTELRTGPKTVDELANTLGLTPNAIRNQLLKLEILSMVARSGARPSASKPSVLYSITLEGQIQFSKLYLPILVQFIRVAEDRCSEAQLEELMSDTGTALAHRYAGAKGTQRQRVYAAARLLRSLGGLTEVGTRDGKLVIRSAGCPLAALTAESRAACMVLESFLGEYLQAPVRNCCSGGEAPHCCFEVAQA